MDEFGVAVHVGVGPTRVCGGGMTDAAGVGGRGLGVTGVEVLGGGRGDGVAVCGAGLVASGGVAVTAATALGEALSGIAGGSARVVSPQLIATRTSAMSPARLN